MASNVQEERSFNASSESYETSKIGDRRGDSLGRNYMALPYHRIGRIALVCGLQVCAVSAQHPTDKGLQMMSLRQCHWALSSSVNVIDFNDLPFGGT
jgi:hypothetical protein